MDVSDADEWWMCDGCFHQFDADRFDVCQNPWCPDSPQSDLSAFEEVEGGA